MLALVTSLTRANGMTLLMVTHEPKDLTECDQVVLIDQSRAAPPVNTAAFLANPPTAWRDYLGA